MGILIVILGLIAGIGGLMFLGAVLDGYVLVKMWAWFIVPIFHLPALSIPYAIGLGLVVTFLTHQYQKEPKETADDSWAWPVRLFAIPILALFIGWIVRHWL